MDFQRGKQHSIDKGDYSNSISGKGDYSDSPFGKGGGGDLSNYIIDVSNMICEIIVDIDNNVPKSVISAKFHNTVAEFIVSVCEMLRSEHGINKVALGGGTFQNTFLLTRVTDQLSKRDFTVYFKKKIPTNDGGISLGQAIIASRSQEKANG